MFSTGGNIISAKRECIKPETLKMLVLIKENYSQVKANIKYWVKNYNDEPGAPPTPVEIPEPTETQAKTQLPSTPRASSQEPQAGGSWLKKTTFTQAKKRLHTQTTSCPPARKKVKSFKPSIKKKSIISWL